MQTVPSADERFDGTAQPVPARRERWHAATLVVLSVGLVLSAFAIVNRAWPSPWSEPQRAALYDLWIGSLGAVPADPSNRFADDPRAARLGARLFRDARLSGNGHLACAGCHDPALSFTDGLLVARGAALGKRNTPSVVPAAYGPAYFWDGRRDSQWAQALTPMESALEMAGTRGVIAGVVARHYRAEYEQIFGALPNLPLERLAVGASPLGTPAARNAWNGLLPAERDAIDRVFANTGKAIAAYQRTLRFEPSRFDDYVSLVRRANHLLAATVLSTDELAGLELFVGKANCTSCHRGPLFTGHEFFSLALPFGAAGPDPGRAGAFRLLRQDPFNCQGAHSDAKPEQCVELRFLAEDTLGFLANFKTPSLRNVAATAPYMHAGQFDTLERVVDHYNSAPRVEFPEHTDIQPLGLSDGERAQIVAFLGTLTSEVHDPFAGERPAQ